MPLLRPGALRDDGDDLFDEVVVVALEARNEGLGLLGLAVLAHQVAQRGDLEVVDVVHEVLDVLADAHGELR
eukprot:CAMPEP_0118889818 /NCGR_PEP_ID=MMETSP1166-20130328/561_1 /TAXON_ID=1104430 /ORGANISM="Chrysoreinhardia sp, Strain CCMP3193" /LENGTH=71 /DNA_ID=CAMNT_0006828413 /DNA_START=49 /DNA_END=265 /DNA_ORIENTATION=-